MRAFVKAKLGNGESSKDASSAASGLAQSSGARYRALAGLILR